MPIIFIISAVIFVILLVVFVILLIKKGKKNKPQEQSDYDTAYNKMCSITDWQRQVVPALAEISGDIGLLRFIDNYLQNNYVWYPGDFDDVDPQYLITLDKILLNEVITNIKNNNYCILLLDAIDRLNGGIELDDNGNRLPWLSSKLGYGDDYEANILSACSLALTYAKDTNIFKEEFINVALEDISSNDFFCYKDNTFAILIVSMVSYIRDMFISKQLDEYSLSFIRVLACLLERNFYPDIISSIEV